MTRTHDKVRYTPKGEPYTPISAAQGVEDALKILEGRWKLVILFHLFGGKVLRFSDLQRAIPASPRRCSSPSTLPEPRVQGVAETVAEQVEAEDGEHDRGAGEEEDPPRAAR